MFCGVPGAYGMAASGGLPGISVDVGFLLSLLYLPRAERRHVCWTVKRKGYRIGILTNGTAVLQQGKVDVVGFRDWFEFVIATREIGPDKPDPYPFPVCSGSNGACSRRRSFMWGTIRQTTLMRRVE